MKLLTGQYLAVSFSLAPFRSRCLPQHLFLSTISRRSSLNARGQISHPYKTESKSIFLCILYIFIQQKEDKRFGPKDNR